MAASTSGDRRVVSVFPAPSSSSQYRYIRSKSRVSSHWSIFSNWSAKVASVTAEASQVYDSSRWARIRLAATPTVPPAESPAVAWIRYSSMRFWNASSSMRPAEPGAVSSGAASPPPVVVGAGFLEPESLVQAARPTPMSAPDDVSRKRRRSMRDRAGEGGRGSGSVVMSWVPLVVDGSGGVVGWAPQWWTGPPAGAGGWSPSGPAPGRAGRRGAAGRCGPARRAARRRW